MSAPVVAVQLCGESLCMAEATHVAHVRELRGHVLYFCAVHADKMRAAVTEAGVADRIDIRPIGGGVD